MTVSPKTRERPRALLPPDEGDLPEVVAFGRKWREHYAKLGIQVQFTPDLPPAR